MLATMASWLTPTVLFCLMNLVIAILFLSHKKPDPDPTRPASLLQRVRSISFSLYDQNPTDTPSLLQRVRSITRPDPTRHHRSESEPNSLSTNSLSTNSLSKTSLPEPETGSGPARMRKSASVRVRPPAEEEVAEEVRRPATMREKKVAEGDDEVDEKADDFINKFKQQLKLQRLDSLLRYKEMLHRGASR